ncbi:NEDD4-binding protein 2 isoform X2 [Mixophyes fleayi]|uniref:NEDD4-binding protein 2 isoform X2 n=1 Tax=Mixophyes fleayi TaxID=3061075 RepID=UPI003F4DF891
MPRRRKSLSASPQRNSSNTSSSLSRPFSASLPLPPAMSTKKEEMLCRMCEMFPNLDPSLVEMVLSEYKEVGIVMDYLLELSTATKGEPQPESTGFHKIASCLDDFHVNTQSSVNVDLVSEQIEDDLYMDGTMCNDLDTLLDEALDKYGLNNAENFLSTDQCEESASTMSTSKVMAELSPFTSIQNTPFQTGHMERIAQSQTELEREDCQDALDLEVTPCDYNTGSFSTSSIDAPKKTKLTKLETDFSTTPDMIFNFETSEKPVNQQGTGSILKTTHSSVPLQTKWNPMASSFYPASNPQSSFCAPVAAIPATWMYVAGAREPFRGIHYTPQVRPSQVWNFNRFPQTHLSPDKIKPISRCEPGIQVGPQVSKKVTHFVGKVLILLRGAPGSGKSTLGRLLLEQNPAGVILSTDDYFSQNGQYQYDVSCLGDAHEWNHKRAKGAFEKTVSPIIIDNTNLQGWEMKPYVSMAMKYKYKVTFREPDTWWKYKPKELERRNCHGIKKEKIKKMLEHFERATVNSILNLSRPKEAESADICQIIKPGEKNRLDSILPPTLKEEETYISKTPVTESENTSDMDVAAVSENSFASEISKDCPEILYDVTQPIIENLTNSDGENENCVDFVQCAEDVNSGDEEPHSNDCSPDSVCLEESTVDECISQVNSNLARLSERTELLSFVGDWPVEQTLSQRAPRSKKKTRPRLEMQDPPVQPSSEEDETIDCSLGQLDNKPIEHDQFKESNILNIEHNIDCSTVNHSVEENLVILENNLGLSLTDEENGDQGDQKSGTDVDQPSIVMQQVTQVIAKNEDVLSGEEDVKIKPRLSRRNCRHCKLALTFRNSCLGSLKDNETHRICESPESIEQVSVGLCKSSQTEPQEFALTWRLEKKNINSDSKVLIGKGNRFKSKLLDTSLESSSIPYRMMHHKSTSVQEDDIIRLGDKDSLHILCTLFRSLSFDVLKDLFERCNKDIAWTTNLLLDSGEKICKDEECPSEDYYRREKEECKHLEGCGPSEDNLHSNNYVHFDDHSILIDKHFDSLKMDDSSFKDNLKASENFTFVNAMPLVVAEEFKNCNVLSSNEGNTSLDYQCRILTELLPNKETVTDTVVDHKLWSSALESGQLNVLDSSVDIVPTSNALKGNPINENNAQELHFPNTNMFQKAGVAHHETTLVDEYVGQKCSSVELVGQQDKTKNNNSGPQSKESLKFDYLELSLPPEFAFQLTELFGPVGIDPGSLTIEDCVVPIDLKLAESIHKMWKESIMERHNQEALSYQLMFEDISPDDHLTLDDVLHGQETGLLEDNSAVSQGDMFPIMDQWNTRIKKVSLRQIMSEELALQAHEDLKKSPSRKNCAVKMKEKQLLELFPYVEKKLLLDVFKENKYSLEKTEEFMSSLLEADPVQNVVAQGMKQAASSATDKTKEKLKKVKADKEILSEHYFQDLEYPDYDDFRAEAFLYHQKQQESYRKAAEAHNRGMKQVAAYYAQQGYLYGQKMKEENRRAAVQIFERANEYLLPENILDLHGLHVDEAMKHFRKVLLDKTDEFKQTGGKPYLLVITGRGNHSQGGVPRIKPAVTDYLTNHDYRFQEKTAGVLRVTLK